MIKPTDHVVHVNRGTIDSNRKWGKSDPVLKVQRGKSGKGQYGRKVEVLDKNGEVAATFHYDESGILVCGAKVVLVAPFGARVVE